MMISFFVEGAPRAKQSFRSLGKRGGYTPAHVKAWQKDVAWAAQQAMRQLGLLDPVRENVCAEFTFFLPDNRKIDLDNLSKSVADGLNGVVWEDDRQVVTLMLHKYICRERPGVLVNVVDSVRDVEITQMRQVRLVARGLLDVAPVSAGERVPA